MVGTVGSPSPPPPWVSCRAAVLQRGRNRRTPEGGIERVDGEHPGQMNTTRASVSALLVLGLLLSLLVAAQSVSADPADPACESYDSADTKGSPRGKAGSNHYTVGGFSLLGAVKHPTRLHFRMDSCKVGLECSHSFSTQLCLAHSSK